jgi:predicted XRE-type DNA-binding protein
MASARNWRDVRAEALKRGRITEAGIADARRVHEEQAQAYQLRQVREELMARQADVAAAMNVSQSRVSKIERGDISHAEVGTLSAYVQALGGILRVTADFGDRVLALGVLPATASLAEPGADPGRRRNRRVPTTDELESDARSEGALRGSASRRQRSEEIRTWAKERGLQVSDRRAGPAELADPARPDKRH